MSASYREWWFVLVDSETGESIDDDSGQLLPLTAGAPTAPTIYSDDKGTTVSNPVRSPRTFTNGVVRFWTARSVSSLDLVVITAKGQAYFLEDVPYSRHRIYVNAKDRDCLLVVPLGASDNSETDTGLDLPSNWIISPFDIKLNVTTLDATETINIGILASETGGDADGFVAAASVGTAGFVELIPQITNGTNIDYVGTNYVGALLATSIAGADAIATVGGWTPKMYRTDGTAKSISYTGSAGTDTAAGYLYVRAMRLPS